ncbi:MAG: hypothetical protein C7B45_02605 [Sulfobacillus acidophilus]|uniref:HTH tetR-type domain-containing protein n=1 Tax=Sulfobacillus acidophilus TaxID=53633 RepID=A0A2T2WN55_9FIRM|nr:MAG: hypothetical protein C7B45_02605 [Sulfobacillus acidophilus]
MTLSAPHKWANQEIRAQREDQIRRVAARLFAHNGYVGTRIEDIAQAVSMSKGLLVVFGLQGAVAVVLHQTTPVTWEIALGIAIVWGLRSVVLHLRYPHLPRILARQ